MLAALCLLVMAVMASANTGKPLVNSETDLTMDDFAEMSPPGNDEKKTGNDEEKPDLKKREKRQHGMRHLIEDKVLPRTAGLLLCLLDRLFDRLWLFRERI